MQEKGKNKLKEVYDASDKLGELFCERFMDKLWENFNKSDKRIHFSKDTESMKSVLCKGTKDTWKDSRIETDSSEYKAIWWVEGNGSSSLKIFFEVIIMELEKRFSDLLYLKEVEDVLRETEDFSGPVVEFFIGELLDKEWLTNRYIKWLLKKLDLPSMELFIQFSAQKYEKRVVSTSMYFLKGDYENSEKILVFDDMNEASRCDRRLSGENLRTIRKLMEMSGTEHGLLIDRDEIKKIYYIKGVVNSDDAGKLPVTEVRFTGHLSWKLIERENILFECIEGKNRIPAVEGKSNEKWKDELEVAMIKLEKKRHIVKVRKIVEELSKQSHGTSIIFMQEDILREEVRRLGAKKRTYPISFNMLTNKDKLLGISAIDGAILSDITGTCHCVGAILDGEAVIEGDSGRGSRYNSVINYANWIKEVYQKKKKEGNWKKRIWCLVVVLSEDGMITVNFFPQCPEERLS